MAGYIGTQPVPQATQTRDTFTATASQTSFATSGYEPNFVDVYMNGIKLKNGDDFTASNGSDVVLTAGAAAGDILEVLAFTTYEVNSQNYTGGLTVDNDGATVLTVDRATSDGTIIDVQKGGTTVGSIGTKAGDLVVGTGDTGLRFSDASSIIEPQNITTNSGTDGTVDLGWSSGRFKDAHFSGTVNANSFSGDGSALTGVGASTTAGDVGTYAWLWRDNAGTTLGSTHAGSTLFYAVQSDDNTTGAVANTYKGNGIVRSGISPSGTWRAMGSAGSYTATYGQATLYVRIS